MLIVTTESVNGGRFEQLGLVRGSSIMTVHAGKDIMNSFKTLVGGELTSYNEMMENARGLATQRMIEQAQSMGADAIVAALKVPVSGKPKFICCNTVKGKGVSFMEDQFGWHGSPMNKEQFEKALSEQEVE